MYEIKIKDILKQINDYIPYKLDIIVKKVKAFELDTYCNYISYENGIIYIYWHYAAEKLSESLTRLAHELGHIKLKHFLVEPDKEYRKRYKYEKAAWKKAVKIAGFLSWQFDKKIMKKYLKKYK